MASNDREAKLKLTTEITGMDKAGDQTAELRSEIVATRDAAASTTEILTATSASLDGLTQSEAAAASTSKDTSAAIAGIGDAAKETASETSQAASGAAQALDGVGVAATEQTAAVRAAGVAGEQSGEQIEAAAKEAAGEVDKLAQEWKEAGDAARDAGAAFDPGEAVAAVRELANQIEGSNDSLDQRREALQGVFDGLAEELKEVSTASGEAGSATTDQARLIEQAMADVQAAIGRVDEGLRQVGETSAETGATTTRSLLSVDEALKLAKTSADQTFTKFNEEGRVSKADVKELAELIATVQLRMEEVAAKGGPVTPQQTAQVNALKNELTDLTSKANALTNASSDNAVALKDAEAQTRSLAATTATLIQVFDANNKTSTAVAGKVGTLANTYSELKKQAAALNLNSIGAAKGVAGVGAQIAAGILVAKVAIATGKKFADTNDANADSISRIGKAVDSVTPSIEGMKDRIAGAQRAAQDAVASLDQYAIATNTLGSSSELLTERTRELIGAQAAQDNRAKDVKQSFVNLSLAIDAGQNAVELYNAAVAAGLDTSKAYYLALRDSAAVNKFFADTRKAGAEGEKLFAEAMRETGGEQRKLLGFIKDHTKELERNVTANSALTATRKQESEQLKELQKQLAAVGELLPDAAENAGALAAMAKTIGETSEKVNQLSDAERERLEILADLLELGPDITREERDLAASLAEQARKGAEANEELNLMARLQLSVKHATAGSSESLAAHLAVLGNLTESYDIHRVQIRHLVGETQDLLDQTDGLNDVQRAHMQETLDRLRAVEEERNRLESLAAARTARFANDAVDNEQRIQKAIRSRITDLQTYLPELDRYGAEVAAVAGEISVLIERNSGLSAAERQRLTLLAELLSKGEAMNANEKRLAATLLELEAANIRAAKSYTDLARAKLEVANLTSELVTATAGSSIAINLHVEEIRKYIDASQTNAIALDRVAGALQGVLAATDGLTVFERERIATLIELAQRGEELTAAEKNYAKQLIDSIESGNLRVKSLEELAEAETKRTDAIKEQIEIVRQQIAQEEERLGTAAKQTAINLDQGASLDYLRQKEAALQREMQTTLTVWSAQNDTRKESEGLRAKEQQSSQQLLAALSNERIAYEKAGEAQDVYFKRTAEGKATIGNLTEEQKKAAEATTAVGTAATGTAGVIRDVFVKELENGKLQIVNVKAEAEDAAKKLDTTADSLNKVADAGAEIPAKWAAMIKIVPDLDAALAGLEKRVAPLAARFAELAIGIDQAYEAAARATAGKQSTVLQD